MSRRPGFTLIELLVVAAVLATLAGLLLPSLAAARQQAQAAVCGSNLRQIALANLLYAPEHGDALCPGAADIVLTNLHRWHGQRDRPTQPFDGRRGPLVPYYGVDGQLRACPALRIDVPPGDPRRFEQNCGGYGYNQQFLGQQLERTRHGGYRLVTDRAGVRSTRIRRPAETLMFADTAFMSDGLIEYSFAEPRYFPVQGTRPDPSLHFRHRGATQVAWADGHVDRHARTFTWSSGLYLGDAAAAGLGWFGLEDDNRLFDLD